MKQATQNLLSLLPGYVWALIGFGSVVAYGIVRLLSLLEKVQS
jgi:hypothetical protein